MTREKIEKLFEWSNRTGVGCGEMENARLKPLITKLLDSRDAFKTALELARLDLLKRNESTVWVDDVFKADDERWAK